MRSIAEILLERGEAKGRAQTLVRLLERRFDPLPRRALERIAAAAPGATRRLAGPDPGHRQPRDGGLSPAGAPGYRRIPAFGHSVRYGSSNELRKSVLVSSRVVRIRELCNQLNRPSANALDDTRNEHPPLSYGDSIRFRLLNFENGCIFSKTWFAQHWLVPRLRRRIQIFRTSRVNFWV